MASEPVITPDEILTVREAAALLKVEERTIYSWTRNRQNRIPYHRLANGKYLRFFRSEILTWLVAAPATPKPRSPRKRAKAAAERMTA
jgi:excisionase family DNA binding protein